MATGSMPKRISATLAALFVVLTACSPDSQTDRDPAASADQTTRNDIDCTRTGLGSDDEVEFEVAYYVIDGQLGETCLGEGNQTLVDAWDLLDTIAPGDSLHSLSVFAGFSSQERGDEISVAFVNSASEDGSLFQMSLNLEAAVEDGDYLAVTLAHELSHVFTALPDQLVRSNFGVGSKSCATYFNGDGCYSDLALMTDWIETFWTDEMIDGVNPIREASADDGQVRCDLNGGFFGAYAASSPEEDFAESFGAYVMQIPARNSEQQARFDWFASRPDISRFRTAAEAAGIGPLENEFDRCG